MRNIPSNRLPLILAIALHIILFSALFIHFSSPDTRNLQLQPEVDIIKAVAVNPADIAAQQTRIKAEEQEKQRQAQEEARKLQQEKQRQEQALAQEKAAQEKAIQQKKAAEQKAEQQKAEAAALLEQQQEEQKQLTEKTVETKKVAEEKTKQEAVEIKKQEQAKKAAEKKQKAAQALKLAQQKALENEMAAEKKQLDAARTDQQQSEIDKYTALILHTMRQNWIIPEGVNPSISCQLAIRLNADGTVISVTLLRSSGNAALDNSARLAVFKSSPLPVPADSALFNEVFRQFNLTVSPKDIE